MFVACNNNSSFRWLLLFIALISYCDCDSCNNSLCTYLFVTLQLMSWKGEIILMEQLVRLTTLALRHVSAEIVQLITNWPQIASWPRTMVSVITEKLGQQTLNDSVDCDHRQQPVDILVSNLTKHCCCLLDCLFYENTALNLAVYYWLLGGIADTRTTVYSVILLPFPLLFHLATLVPKLPTSEILTAERRWLI